MVAGARSDHRRARRAVRHRAGARRRDRPVDAGRSGGAGRSGRSLRRARHRRQQCRRRHAAHHRVPGRHGRGLALHPQPHPDGRRAHHARGHPAAPRAGRRQRRDDLLGQRLPARPRGDRLLGHEGGGLEPRRSRCRRSSGRAACASTRSAPDRCRRRSGSARTASRRTIATSLGVSFDEATAPDHRRRRRRSPTGRFTEPEEVADLVLLLASDRAGNVTGADFLIDGGLDQDRCDPAPSPTQQGALMCRHTRRLHPRSLDPLVGLGALASSCSPSTGTHRARRAGPVTPTPSQATRADRRDLDDVGIEQICHHYADYIDTARREADRDRTLVRWPDRAGAARQRPRHRGRRHRPGTDQGRQDPAVLAAALRIPGAAAIRPTSSARSR